MKSLMTSILLRVFSFLKGLLPVVELVAPYVNMVYPIVVEISKLIPTKTDDNIIKAYEKFKVELNISQLVAMQTPEEKSLFLRDLARKLLRVKFGIDENKVADSILNAAIELAYNKYKLEEGSVQVQQTRSTSVTTTEQQNLITE